MSADIHILRDLILPYIWNSGIFSSSVIRQNLIDQVFRFVWYDFKTFFYQLGLELVFYFTDQIFRFILFISAYFRFLLLLIFSFLLSILQILPFVFLSYFYTTLILYFKTFFEIMKKRIIKIRIASRILEKEKYELKKYTYLTDKEKCILEKYFSDDCSPPSKGLLTTILNETNLSESKIKNWWYKKTHKHKLIDFKKEEARFTQK